MVCFDVIFVVGVSDEVMFGVVYEMCVKRKIWMVGDCVGCVVFEFVLYIMNVVDFGGVNELMWRVLNRCGGGVKKCWEIVLWVLLFLVF